MTEPQSSKLQVSVTFFEAIVSGGVRKVSWRIFNTKEDDWISVFDHPGAEAENLDQTAGVVWQKRVHLLLEVGSRLLRYESRPKPRERRDPMSFLEGTRNNAKDHTIRVEFCLNRTGKLIRTKAALPR